MARKPKPSFQRAIIRTSVGCLSCPRRCDRLGSGWPPASREASRIPDRDQMQSVTPEEATKAVKSLNQYLSRGLDHDVVPTRRALLLVSLVAGLAGAFLCKAAI